MSDSINISEQQLLAIFERVERLREDRKAIDADIAEVFAEAKGNGFDPKIIKLLLKERAKPEAERSEEEAVLDLYRQAIFRAENSNRRAAA